MLLTLVEWIREMEQAAESLAGVQEPAAAFPADFARLYQWPWPARGEPPASMATKKTETGCSGERRSGDDTWTTSSS